MRFPVVLSTLAAGALAPFVAHADCSDDGPCLDAEPMWLSPSARHFSVIPDTDAPASGEFAFGLSVGFRLKPLVLQAPAPSAAGRQINLILHTTDLAAGLWLGIGNRMELTLALPAGLYQRGAGIKGVTHQTAPPLPEQSLHDPRIGFGYALPFRLLTSITFKLQLELKLPLGDQASLMGEQSFVIAPALVARARQGRWLGGSAVGLRLRRPTDFFGRRVGTQLLAALGLGYELPRPRLAFTLEAYVSPSLPPANESNDQLDVPAEWLASIGFSPRAVRALSFGVSGGSSIPMPHGVEGWQSGIGAPLLRMLVFARWLPAR